jgi:hypothetical protein
MIDKLEELYFGFVMLVVVVGVIFTLYDFITGAL